MRGRGQWQADWEDFTHARYVMAGSLAIPEYVRLFPSLRLFSHLLFGFRASLD